MIFSKVKPKYKSKSENGTNMLEDAWTLTLTHQI